MSTAHVTWPGNPHSGQPQAAAESLPACRPCPSHRHPGCLSQLPHPRGLCGSCQSRRPLGAGTGPREGGEEACGSEPGPAPSPAERGSRPGLHPTEQGVSVHLLGASRGRPGGTQPPLPLVEAFPLQGRQTEGPRGDWAGGQPAVSMWGLIPVMRLEAARSPACREGGGLTGGGPRQAAGAVLPWGGEAQRLSLSPHCVGGGHVEGTVVQAGGAGGC